MRHLPISVYCEQYHDTAGAINKRIERGYWVDGIHVFKCDGFAERCVDLEEIDKWFGREKLKSKKKRAA